MLKILRFFSLLIFMSDLIFDFLAPTPFLHGNEIFKNICRNANWEEMGREVNIISTTGGLLGPNWLKYKSQIYEQQNSMIRNMTLNRFLEPKKFSFVNQQTRKTLNDCNLFWVYLKIIINMFSLERKSINTEYKILNSYITQVRQVVHGKSLRHSIIFSNADFDVVSFRI